MNGKQRVSPMNRSDTQSEDDVRAALTFVVPQDEKPYFHSSVLTGGAVKIFFETEDRQVSIRDMRPIAAGLPLDRQGFVLHRHETALQDLYDDAAIERIYNRETEDLLKAYAGADQVVIFDHTRRSDDDVGAANPDGVRGPAARVHVDYTTVSGPIRARAILGEELFDRIIEGGGRIVQVNVWRPITGPVRRTPLALADAESIRPEELVATEQIFPDRVGEIFQLAYAPEQLWYWAPRMDRDEVLLIKGWDSIDDGRARFTPHGAFRLPDQRPEDPVRQSIETRTYMLFEG